MDYAALWGGLIGSIFGAVLIAGVILVAFRLFKIDTPRFANAWKGAYAASVVVIIADWLATGLLPESYQLFVLPLVLIGAFFAYDRILQNEAGERLGRKPAVVAVASHTVFSTAMFLLVYPVLISAVAAL